MDLYRTTFAVLVVGSVGLAYSQYQRDREALKAADAKAGSVELNNAATAFKWKFIPVYLLGPYVYTLYKDEYGLAEPTVAMLFAAGFVAAAVSATFVGSLADKYGRRMACMAFCITYALSCLTKLSSQIVTLLIGRLLGGVATTLMYSVFESWMVTEYFARSLDKSNMSLDSMFGLMTALNGVVAILSGVVGESVVAMTGTKTSPFMAAIVLLMTALVIMKKGWNENYGDRTEVPKGASDESSLKVILKDKRILILGFVCCVFEGSMYLFVFFWSAALKSAHAYSNPSAKEQSSIPFGLIFATFMAAMMLGSIAFSRGSSEAAASKSISMLGPAHFLTIAIAVSTASLLTSVLIKSETLTFWCFCLFEACIGIYYPCMGALRGRIVGDGARAKVYGFLRIPLNFFVVVLLCLTKEGDAHRDRIFTFCGGLLLAGTVLSACYLGDTTEGTRRAASANMSWAGFKKNVNRATTQVMMKTGHVEKTNDRDYEVEERRYRTMEAASLRLQKEAKGYLDSLRAMTRSQMAIAETIDAFYGDSGANDGVSRSYKQAVADLDAETIKALDGPYRTTVLEPISRFCAYFPDINECIKKRNHKLLDYDAMRAKVKKLVEKPDKDASKLPRAEKEADMAKVAYEQLNEQLFTELPQLIDLRVPYLDPSFEALVKIQLRFCAEAYSRMAQVQQYLDAETRDQYAEGHLDTRVEQVLQEIRELSISGTV
ncbi:hypothetical protein V500_07783 [Pseudogymnoascus sp. VKM F-4518 (FW-2643)]|nr:hypothetical protein V500_07783 [Pseudogymnoascus sp. VKM F-4518 (FW-2643)]